MQQLCGLGKIEIIANYANWAFSALRGEFKPDHRPKTYENILGIKPSLAYVNEQVLSDASLTYTTWASKR